jgi:lipopolysaccharide export system protein LptA
MTFHRRFAPVLLIACASLRAETDPTSMISLDAGSETVIEATSLEFESRESEARFIFDGNVRVRATNLTVTCDRMEIFSQREGDPDAPIGKIGRIRQIDAIGNVIVTQGLRKATAGRALLKPIDGVIVMTGDPTVVDPDGVVSGERITLFRGESRVQVEKPRLTMSRIPDLGPGTKSEGAGSKPAP